ncbi:sensor histidine kinase [Cryptosporangium sp. NPDC051539]|uniref:sensor histidine kinase n=1 Tax=Cryptosporangium sp. NPDC051539 TaxID=3363962 RepID=UPI00378A4F5A
MSATSLFAVPGVGFVVRTARRTVVESLYLVTGPPVAAAGALVVLVSLCAGTVVSLLRGGRPVGPGFLAPAHWAADVERWRIERVRPATKRPTTERPPTDRTGPSDRSGAADPGAWLDAAHPAIVLPVSLITGTITALWWFVAVGGTTARLRNDYAAGPLPPMTLTAGSAGSHIDLSLGLASPSARMLFGTLVGLALFCTLPLLTRACVAAQARLGQALLSDASALHRRIRGLELERDTARAQTVAAVSAEASALRRLERDIHDGPQQRLVRLALELGRARHHLDTRPETVREALADAAVQAQEALEELRALSRGIAPPILVDRGLREALTALAARSTVPVEIDAGADRLDPAVETAAYFVVAEALTNVAKHSGARRATITLRRTHVAVTDDGAGGAALDKGHGLRGLDDRVRAVGGRLLIVSPAGGPTTITAELP